MWQNFPGIVISSIPWRDDLEDGAGRELGLNGAIKKRAQFISLSCFHSSLEMRTAKSFGSGLAD